MVSEHPRAGAVKGGENSPDEGAGCNARITLALRIHGDGHDAFAGQPADNFDAAWRGGRGGFFGAHALTDGIDDFLLGISIHIAAEEIGELCQNGRGGGHADDCDGLAALTAGDDVLAHHFG